MKRFFTITLIACILASVFPLGLGAAEANRDIEQNLVVHYDFDGTDEEYLKNKAENSLAEQLLAGTEQDDLTGDLYVKSDEGFLRDAELHLSRTPWGVTAAMAGDKKRAGGKIRLVLLRSLGDACVHTMELRDFEELFRRCL